MHSCYQPTFFENFQCFILLSLWLKLQTAKLAPWAQVSHANYQRENKEREWAIHNAIKLSLISNHPGACVVIFLDFNLICSDTITVHLYWLLKSCIESIEIQNKKKFNTVVFFLANYTSDITHTLHGINNC